ncbi:MAG: hypothetical protein LUF78_00570 [Clostridiales bacterium]|nr:hypothetical protein [Clostridiales bacterium]
MRKNGFILFLCLLCCISLPVSADITDYEEAVQTYEEENQALPTFLVDDGEGNTVNVAAWSDTLYVISSGVTLRSNPGEAGEAFAEIPFNTQISRVAVCDNGWSKVTCEIGGTTVMGYADSSALDETSPVTEVSDSLKAVEETDILSYPGKKDGEIVGEVASGEEVTRTGTVNEIWSQILYLDSDGQEQVGYISTACLEGQEEILASASGETEEDSSEETGVLSEGSGEGIFVDAVESVTSTGGSTSTAVNVQVGTPVSVSSDATLVSLGVFRVTHYCPCSICCGPYANGITSTGVTATTNHTVAVYPSQIPYGSQVVINGQVYVAEDCGGAITTNRIDIYVATHAEAEALGVLYTEVYLLQ